MTETWEQMEARHCYERRLKMQELTQEAYGLGSDGQEPPEELAQSIASINAAIARKYKVSPNALLGKGRRQDICDIRHEAWAAQKKAGHSYPKIGRAYSGRDHTTILNGVRRYNERNGGSA